jgi:murein L,D-transpeptidase YafK
MRIGPFAAIMIGLLQFMGACSVAPPQEPLGQVQADRVILEKGKRELHLLSAGKVVRTYQVALGRSPVGPKTQEGDGKTPEGQYVVDGRNGRSAYHRALHISYPAAADIARARRAGVKPGGDIMIHGIRNGFGWIGPLHRTLDWTQGCIAVTNREIEEIWAAVPDGTPIELKP